MKTVQEKAPFDLQRKPFFNFLLSIHFWNVCGLRWVTHLPLSPSLSIWRSVHRKQLDSCSCISVKSQQQVRKKMKEGTEQNTLLLHGFVFSAWHVRSFVLPLNNWHDSLLLFSFLSFMYSVRQLFFCNTYTLHLFL